MSLTPASERAQKTEWLGIGERLGEEGVRRRGTSPEKTTKSD